MTTDGPALNSTSPTVGTMPPAPPRGAAGLLGDHGVTMLRRVTVLASIGSLGAALTSVDLQHLQWLDLRYVVIALACGSSCSLWPL